MAYDSVRAQLDKLLGPDRNGPLTDSAAHATPHYTDSSVCKHYLLGFCPNDLFIKHRSEPGSCRDLHSDAAKLAFEKDVAAGKAKREKAMWMRVLLKECRSIVLDEDRKIRGHARRLQDTYRAQGDLSSLMIRNFDTLKKLGMVSPDAKIKVGNEEDDDDFLDEQGNFFEKDEQKNGHDDHTAKESSQKTGLPTDATLGNDEDADGFGIVKVIPGDNGDGDGDGDADADAHADDNGDIDEFGRVKKAMADNNESADLPDSTKVESEDDSSDGKPSDVKPSENGNDSDDSDDGFDVVKVTYDSEDGDATEKKAEATRPEKEGNSRSNEGEGSENFVNRDRPEADAEKQGKDEAKSELQNVEGIHSDEGRTEATNNTNRRTADASETTGKAMELASNNKRSDIDDSAVTKQVPSADEIMDKFYEAGEGPDGLIMLDRKQSLRVCACCGGYISLVDAESRLLSHFGGKSHHSLAVLRDKVVELEGAVRELESQPGMSLDERGGRYRDERDHHSMRSEYNRRDRRDYDSDRPRWMRRDTEYGRDRRRDGDSHGVYANEPRWYGRGYDRHDRGHERDHDRHRHNRGEQGGFNGDYYGRRGGQQERSFMRERYPEAGRPTDDPRRDRRDNRYESTRKRRRSSSPYKNNRRSRRH